MKTEVMFRVFVTTPEYPDGFTLLFEDEIEAKAYVHNFRLLDSRVTRVIRDPNGHIISEQITFQNKICRNKRVSIGL